MNKDFLNKIVQESFENVDKLVKLDKMLESAKGFSINKGIPLDELLDKILNKYSRDFHSDLCDELATYPEGKYLEGSHYGQVARLARDQLIELINKQDEYKLNESYIVRYRVNLKFYLSNLIKSVDVFTNMLSYYNSLEIIESIREKCNESMSEYIDSIIAESALSYDVKTALSIANIYDKELLVKLKLWNTLIIVDDYLINNPITYTRYCKEVSEDAREVLQYSKYSLLKDDVEEFFCIPVEKHLELAIKLEEELGHRDDEISLIPDYNICYRLIANNEQPRVKHADITTMDSLLLEKSIVDNKLDEQLRINILSGGLIRKNNSKTGEF